jgi:hypothetical protein
MYTMRPRPLLALALLACSFAVLHLAIAEPEPPECDSSAALKLAGKATDQMYLTDETLAAILQSKSTLQKDIILHTFVINRHWHKQILRNFVWQLQKFSLEQHALIVCGTPESCCHAWNAGIPAYMQQLSSLSKEEMEQAGKPEILKWLLTRHILRLGFNVLFMDWDIGLRANPLRLVDRSHDLEMSSDAHRPLAPGKFSCGIGRYRVTVNACVNTG